MQHRRMVGLLTTDGGRRLPADATRVVAPKAVASGVVASRVLYVCLLEHLLALNRLLLIMLNYQQDGKWKLVLEVDRNCSLI